MHTPPTVPPTDDDVTGLARLEREFERIAEAVEVGCHQAAHQPHTARVPMLVAVFVAAARYDRPAMAARYDALAGPARDAAWRRLEQRCHRACASLLGRADDDGPAPPALTITMATTSLLALLPLAWTASVPLPPEALLIDELVSLLQPYLAAAARRPRPPR